MRTPASALFGTPTMVWFLVCSGALLVASATADEPTPAEVVKASDLAVSSYSGRLLDATLTVSAEVETARLMGESAYTKRGMTPPPFLEHLLVEYFSDAQGRYVAVSSLEPIHVRKFSVLLMVDDAIRQLNFNLKRFVMPKREPKRVPLMKEPEVMGWLLEHLATMHGASRAAILLELRHLAAGAVYPVGTVRPVLRYSSIKWPSRVLKSLYRIAVEQGVDPRKPQFNLFNEPKLLRHLVSASERELADDGQLLAKTDRIEQLEQQVASLKDSLSARQDVAEKASNMWWLQYQLWWFIAGGFACVAGILLLARAFVS